ncbi:LysR family transcriptional regulator [Nocardia concava]|uniref:LysR family transcriptional regulator n=1 Tax=Nocardia concava TaxID=257281 RepID=UPI0002E07C95|nr:LysR family transcriptional regulator [Nocardia concava]
MELRQLRYFVTLAEELHFGRAAAREHIVQSALSQQIQRLERELRVPLVERSTHHVRLTAAGTLLLAEARLILSHVDRAAAAARTMTGTDAVLRVAMGDASFDTMPVVLAAVRQHHPNLLEVHEVEAGCPSSAGCSRRGGSMSGSGGPCSCRRGWRRR